jgi:archaellum component FlaC
VSADAELQEAGKLVREAIEMIATIQATVDEHEEQLPKIWKQFNGFRNELDGLRSTLEAIETRFKPQQRR